jgi:hypothetical protein
MLTWLLEAIDAFAKDHGITMTEATWSSSFVNDLPDASFLYIADGGTKEDGKTTPRSLRYFPVKDKDGTVDLPHLRNALARIPQAKIPAAAKEKAKAKAEALAKEHGVDTASAKEAAAADDNAAPDATAASRKAALKKPGRMPVRIGAKVTTAKGDGKVSAVDGDNVTVTLGDGTTETMPVSAMKAHMAAKTRKDKAQVPNPGEAAAKATAATESEDSDTLVHEDSWDDIMGDVRDAVSKKFGYGSMSYPGTYCYVQDLFDDYVIIKAGDDLFRVQWSQSGDDEVELGEMEPVDIHYVVDTTMAEGCILMPLDDQERMLEGDAKPTGAKWRILVIQEGLSRNRNYYPASVLREAAPLYENKPIYVHHEEQPSRFGRSPNEAIGFVKDVSPAAVGGTKESLGTSALTGTAVILDLDWRRKLTEAWDEGNRSFVGFSHDVDVMGRLMVGDSTSGGAYKRAEKIERVKSVDLVMNPAAGGRLMQMVAANGFTEADLEDRRMLSKMIEAIKASKRPELIALLEALGKTASEDDVMKLYSRLHLQEAAAGGGTGGAGAGNGNGGTGTGAGNGTGSTSQPLSLQEADEMRAALKASRVANVKLSIDAGLRDCALPVPVKDSIRSRLVKMVEAGSEVTEAVITAEIKESVEVYGKVFEKSVRLPNAGAMRFEVTKSSREQFAEALDDFFETPRYKDGKLVPRQRQLRSFRELYIQFTGDDRVTGHVAEATRLTESLDSTSFSHVLGDSITRRMVAEYQLPQFALWRGRIGEVVPVNDFRTQRRLRFGGYGNFPIVAQGAPYGAMTSPSDEEATYAPAKRGGTEAVALEMIKNDDVGVIKRIPVRLGRAAGQTLYEFVFDFMRTNAAVYDSVALAASGHGSNLGTSALAASQVSTGRLKIREQTDMSSGKRLGLTAKWLWVPPDLEELAFQLTNSDKAEPDANLASQAEPAAPNYIKKIGIQAVTVDYWTDADDWWLTADIADTPMIEVGFLDGREDPELFVQDQPNVGSLFSNDQITWKLRHIYGGAVLDYRGFYGNLVD